MTLLATLRDEDGFVLAADSMVRTEMVSGRELVGSESKIVPTPAFAFAAAGLTESPIYSASVMANAVGQLAGLSLAERVDRFDAAMLQMVPLILDFADALNELADTNNPVDSRRP
jgi:hypothetical protein